MDVVGVVGDDPRRPVAVENGWARVEGRGGARGGAGRERSVAAGYWTPGVA